MGEGDRLGDLLFRQVPLETEEDVDLGEDHGVLLGSEGLRDLHLEALPGQVHLLQDGDDVHSGAPHQGHEAELHGG